VAGGEGEYGEPRVARRTDDVLPRAQEYDQWFLRQGRYDRGPEHRGEWFREVKEMEAVLRLWVRGAEVLELACGTGLWTQQLAENNRHILAVDASPEAIAINRQRVGSGKVDYCLADIFAWTPATTFDVVFFSFWLSHVPPERFDAFWGTVRAALKPGGQAFFIDGLLEPSSTARDHVPPNPSGVVRRRLHDGREFDVVKVFYQPEVLEQRLSERGWRGWVRSTGKFFLYGSMAAMLPAKV
jgi:demethylmenaquinone methyltransferase/2-methoxy-6-polyprenyl-1,4-benzoquinol methylase